MSEKKGVGAKVLGWFVVREDTPKAEESADALIARYASEETAAPPPEVVLTGELPKVSTSGEVDYAAVFRAAGIDEEEQGRVEKAATLLKTLPVETPKEVKRQIVEASLKSFGYPVDKIIEAGAQEIQALEVYIQAGQRDTQALLQGAQQQIAQHEQQIAALKKSMETQVGSQYALTQACNQQKLRVQEVLEFFEQDEVARVVQDSPKLHVPDTK